MQRLRDLIERVAFDVHSARRPLLAGPAHLAAGRMEERQRSARPGEHAHLGLLRGLGEEVPQCRPAELQLG